jgi:hypothetical protein
MYQPALPKSASQYEAGSNAKQLPDASALNLVFDTADLDRDGILCTEELLVAVEEVFRDAGLAAANDPEVMDRIVATVLTDADGCVDRKGFASSMEELVHGIAGLNNLSDAAVAGVRHVQELGG